MSTRYKDKDGNWITFKSGPKEIYKKDHKWDIPNKNVAKDITDFYKIIQKKADLMKKQYKLGQRKRVKGITDVVEKSDWVDELKRDKKLYKTLKDALDQEQDLGGKTKKGFLGIKTKTKKKPAVGPNIKDIVKLLSEQGEDRHEFKTLFGDYDKAAEQEVSKTNKRVYPNNTYEEGK